MSTNANEHVLLALDSDRMDRDDVEISWGGDQLKANTWMHGR